MRRIQGIRQMTGASGIAGQGISRPIVTFRLHYDDGEARLSPGASMNPPQSLWYKSENLNGGSTLQ